jgi:hypothetical protein
MTDMSRIKNVHSSLEHQRFLTDRGMKNATRRNNWISDTLGRRNGRRVIAQSPDSLSSLGRLHEHTAVQILEPACNGDLDMFPLYIDDTVQNEYKYFPIRPSRNTQTTNTNNFLTFKHLVMTVANQKYIHKSVRDVIMKCFPIVYLSMALQPFCWTLAAIFSFLTLYTVGRTPWTGDQPVARLLPTHRTTQTQNKFTDIHALSGIRTDDSSVRASEDSSCLRLRGHCDRPF